MPPPPAFSQIEHFVVLMLENRSFDHLLGFLYSKQGNVSPLGHPFAGLTGNEENPATDGTATRVFPIPATDEYLYYYPKSDPGEGFYNTNAQIYGTTKPAAGAPATNRGFVTNFGATLKYQEKDPASWDILPGTVETDIMGIYTPESLPILSGLARGYAVCDAWFGSAPTETLPNRAFLFLGTSQGHLDDSVHVYTAPSFFTLLGQHGCSWAIYGYDQLPLAQQTVADITHAPASQFGTFSDFQRAAAAGTLANYIFLEPSWGHAGSSQHPNYDVSAGEALIEQVYRTLFASPSWKNTLLIITYDEHGGCYDHVPPPATATPPDTLAGQFGFDFRRFGPRVPAVLVSPWIEAGTVYEPVAAASGAPPFDHTSILKTVELRFGLPALTKRDAAAPDFAGVLSRSTPRTDDPLAGVHAPVNSNPGKITNHVTHLQRVQAECVASEPTDNETAAIPHRDGYPAFASGDAAAKYIRDRAVTAARPPPA